MLICSVQLREAVKYSFFLDSYNASATENYTTDTGSVSRYIHIVYIMYQSILSLST